MSTSQSGGKTGESASGGSATPPDLLLSAPIRSDPFSSGEVIADKYEFQRVIGVGGVAIVVAARHVDLDELVAIKLLKPELQDRKELVRRFAREAKASVRIKSEYAARVYDVGIAKGRGPYLVMEYLEGRDLGVYLVESGRLPVKKAVEYTMQACEALAVAHANGIIHRDIKPENLFLAKRVDDTEVLKVLDFGISKSALTGSVFGMSESFVQTQEVMGTPLYMSPEQIRASSEVDCRTDIWSLGVVLYELVTGELAFDGEAITTICADVLEREPLPMSRHVPEIPDGFEEVVKRCLAKDPSARFQSVGELAIALMPFGPTSAHHLAERATTIVAAGARSEGRLGNPDIGSSPPSDRRSARDVRAALMAARGVGSPSKTPAARPSAVSTPPVSVPERAAPPSRVGSSSSKLQGAIPFLFAGALVAGGLLVALVVLALDRQADGESRTVAAAPVEMPAARSANGAPPRVVASVTAPAAVSTLPPPSATPEAPAATPESIPSAKPSSVTSPGPAPSTKPAASAALPPRVEPGPSRSTPLPEAAAPATAQPDCNSPFYFEGTKKIFKPGCL